MYFLQLTPWYGLLYMKKCYFLHNGYTMETIARVGRKLKKRRKGQFQQSYILASLTHRSSPKPADIQITTTNYEGEDLTYNTSWRKLQEVKEVSTKVVEKPFELVIPFLEEWKENNPQSTVEWVVNNQKCILHVFVCLAYMDQVLSYMHPVISVDVAHLHHSRIQTQTTNRISNNNLSYNISKNNNTKKATTTITARAHSKNNDQNIKSI